MNISFKILEQRGKYRIEKTELRAVQNSTQYWTGCYGVVQIIDDLRGETAVDVKIKTEESVKVTGNWFRKTITKTITEKVQPEYKKVSSFIAVKPKRDLGNDTYTYFTSSMEFDTYKKAESYIKKHYGLEGVKAIKEPDWRIA